MSEAVNRLKADLNGKLAHLQSRLDTAKARLHEREAATRVAVREQLEKAKAESDAQKVKFDAARERAKNSLEEKIAETEQKIAEWKAARELKKLTKRAGRAEQYAADSILLAVAALDEADCATLEAIEARILAEEAAAGA